MRPNQRSTSPLLRKKKRAMKLSPKIKAKICELKDLSVLHPDNVEKIGSHAWLMRLLVHINNEDVTLEDVQRWILVHPWILGKEGQTRSKVTSTPKKTFTLKIQTRKRQPKMGARLKLKTKKQSSKSALGNKKMLDSPEPASLSGSSSPGAQADDFPPSPSSSVNTDDDNDLDGESKPMNQEDDHDSDSDHQSPASPDNSDDTIVPENMETEDRIDSQTNSASENQENSHNASFSRVMQSQRMAESQIPHTTISSKPEPGLGGTGPTTQSRYTIIFESESVSPSASRNTAEVGSDASAQFSASSSSGMAPGFGSRLPQFTSTSAGAASGSKVYRPRPIPTASFPQRVQSLNGPTYYPIPEIPTHDVMAERTSFNQPLAQQEQEPFLSSRDPRFNINPMNPSSLYAQIVQNSNRGSQLLAPSIIPRMGWSFQDANMLHNIVAHLEVLSVYLRVLPNAQEPIQRMSELMQALIQYNRNQYYHTGL